MSDKDYLRGTPLCHGGMMDMDDAEVRYMHLQCELEQVRKELVEERIIREAVEAEAHMQSLERNAANQRGDELEIERDALAAQVKKLTWNLENAENLFQVARRRAWEFHDRPSTCPYCMAQMPCTKDAVTGHHAVCPRDPMRKVEAELEQARKELVEVKAEMWYLEPTEEGCGGATWKMYAEHLSLECNELRKELGESKDCFGGVYECEHLPHGWLDMLKVRAAAELEKGKEASNAVPATKAPDA